jgi:hypothetical protein
MSFTLRLSKKGQFRYNTYFIKQCVGPKRMTHKFRPILVKYRIIPQHHIKLYYNITLIKLEIT